ncbi:RNA-binding protein MEX3B [Patagioenas fasciata monilis]|uniref:RNA-binding protein MEX3B n=1 Tax=Patagioenas fasciata monilis TaxID=372326 RepID=A0A1V4JEN7_PATFA|nr:RNA-binding protein MEX3B [Patagioenas fasciata monilis]
MTECVPVPSSEHVAEIVGRQGCKIKALRAKTNTYIKTPVRGEEPLFVVTGRKEDVAMARREIISAAEHFSMIRASRNKNTALNGTVPGPPNLPGQTTIQGATIKRIQQQTHTYIVTPSRDKEPVFEVTGMPENVDRAREEIEAHIAMRTGGIIELTDENDFHANGTDVGFELNGTGSLWSKPTPPSITPTPGRKPFCNYRNDSSSSLGSASTDSYFGGGTGGGGGARLADYSPPSPALSFTHNGNNNNNSANGYVKLVILNGGKINRPSAVEKSLRSNREDGLKYRSAVVWKAVSSRGASNQQRLCSSSTNAPTWVAKASLDHPQAERKEKGGFAQPVEAWKHFDGTHQSLMSFSCRRTSRAD